jgi:hypothetical protein
MAAMTNDAMITFLNEHQDVGTNCFNPGEEDAIVCRVWDRD